jgi:transcriptional regulator with XRE-family HTH domain
MSIGSKIRQVRTIKNIKQEDLARHLNMGQSTLSKIESDSTPISAEDLLKIADYTQTPLTQFLPDGLSINVQNNHDNANGVYISQTDKTDLLLKRLADLEEWIKDLKAHNIELKEKITRRDNKIENLKTLLEAKVYK